MKIATIKHALDEYFFDGEQSSTGDALWYYGTMTFLAVVTLAVGSLYVLNL